MLITTLPTDLVLSLALTTAYGSWSPLLWLLGFAIAVGIAVAIRSRGSGEYNKDGEQTRPFLSGDKANEEAEKYVAASNLYYGFFETLKGYYSRLVPMHTGDVGDYLLWIFAVAAVIMAIGVIR